jgi:hypothetical protein
MQDLQQIPCFADQSLGGWFVGMIGLVEREWRERPSK